MAETQIVVFWQNLGRIVAALLAEKAHAELTITVRDGQVSLVNVSRNYLPTALPK